MNPHQKAAASISERLKEVDFDSASQKMKRAQDLKIAAKGPTDAEIIAQRALDKVFAENQKLEDEQRRQEVLDQVRQERFKKNWPLVSVVLPLYGPKGGIIAMVPAHVTAVVDHIGPESCVIRVVGGDGWPVALSLGETLRRLGL